MLGSMTWMFADFSETSPTVPPAIGDPPGYVAVRIPASFPCRFAARTNASWNSMSSGTFRVTVGLSASEMKMNRRVIGIEQGRTRRPVFQRSFPVLRPLLKLDVDFTKRPGGLVQGPCAQVHRPPALHRYDDVRVSLPSPLQILCRGPRRKVDMGMEDTNDVPPRTSELRPDSEGLRRVDLIPEGPLVRRDVLRGRRFVDPPRVPRPDQKPARLLRIRRAPRLFDRLQDRAGHRNGHGREAYAKTSRTLRRPAARRSTSSGVLYT